MRAVGIGAQPEKEGAEDNRCDAKYVHSLEYLQILTEGLHSIIEQIINVKATNSEQGYDPIFVPGLRAPVPGLFLRFLRHSVLASRR